MGYSAREKVVAQINRSMTTNNDEKSKSALMVGPGLVNLASQWQTAVEKQLLQLC